MNPNLKMWIQTCWGASFGSYRWIIVFNKYMKIPSAVSPHSVDIIIPNTTAGDQRSPPCGVKLCREADVPPQLCQKAPDRWSTGTDSTCKQPQEPHPSNNICVYELLSRTATAVSDSVTESEELCLFANWKNLKPPNWKNIQAGIHGGRIGNQL